MAKKQSEEAQKTLASIASQSGTGKTPEEIYPTFPNMMASIVAGMPIDVLEQNAKDGDDAAFFKLIILNTMPLLRDPSEKDKTEKFYRPIINSDMDFYSRGWVQERLRQGFEGEGRRGKRFRREFWQAVFSWVSESPTKVKRASKKDLELRMYVGIKKDDWNRGLTQKEITYADIERELVNAGRIEDSDYDDKDSLRKYLNGLGVKGKSGRRKKRESKN